MQDSPWTVSVCPSQRPHSPPDIRRSASKRRRLCHRCREWMVPLIRFGHEKLKYKAAKHSACLILSGVLVNAIRMKCRRSSTSSLRRESSSHSPFGAHKNQRSIGVPFHPRGRSGARGRRAQWRTPRCWTCKLPRENHTSLDVRQNSEESTNIPLRPRSIMYVSICMYIHLYSQMMQLQWYICTERLRQMIT